MVPKVGIKSIAMYERPSAVEGKKLICLGRFSWSGSGNGAKNVPRSYSSNSVKLGPLNEAVHIYCLHYLSYAQGRKWDLPNKGYLLKEIGATVNILWFYGSTGVVSMVLSCAVLELCWFYVCVGVCWCMLVFLSVATSTSTNQLTTRSCHGQPVNHDAR